MRRIIVVRGSPFASTVAILLLLLRVRVALLQRLGGEVKVEAVGPRVHL